MLGLIIAILGGIAGVAWLLVYEGGAMAFAVVIAAALLGWLSFMYCYAWEQSLPIGG